MFIRLDLIGLKTALQIATMHLLCGYTEEICQHHATEERQANSCVWCNAAHKMI